MPGGPVSGRSTSKLPVPPCFARDGAGDQNGIEHVALRDIDEVEECPADASANKIRIGVGRFLESHGAGRDFVQAIVERAPSLTSESGTYMVMLPFGPSVDWQFAAANWVLPG